MKQSSNYEIKYHYFPISVSFDPVLAAGSLTDSSVAPNVTAGLDGPSRRITVVPTEQPQEQPSVPEQEPTVAPEREKEPVPA